MTMKHILLVEDDQWLGESYERVLKQHFSVTYVHSLQDALPAIDTKQPDLIIADFMFDGRNVMELLHEISSYGDTWHIPVILCSTIGNDLDAYAEQLEHYGVVRVCDKADITPQSLQRIAREAMAARKAS